jgi:hypothetical protein
MTDAEQARRLIGKNAQLRSGDSEQPAVPVGEQVPQIAHVIGGRSW